MPDRDREIRNQLAAVREALDQFARKIDSEERYEALTDSVAKLDSLTALGTGLDISDFFENIGRGLTKAQKDLDDESLAGIQRYVDDAASSETGGTPLPVPSVYRIPKVSAELQFTLRSQEGKKFNILLFGEESEQELKRQHKVAFDVVAAPPPPDVLEQIESRNSAALVATRRLIESESSVRQVLVLDLDERARVRGILRAYIARFKGASQVGADAIKIVETLSHQSFLPRVLMLRHDSMEQWACIDPGSKSSRLDDPSIVFVSYVGSEDPSTIKEEDVIVHSDTGKKWNTLSHVLWDLSVRQATALREVAGPPRDEQ